MPIIEVNNAEKPQQCKAEAKVGNPINALTGAKSEHIATGVSIGGFELALSYDSTSKSSTSGGDLGTTLVQLNSFGALWRSSFHHKLQVAGNLKGALLSRGDGKVINFDGNGSGGFTAPGDNPHRLVSITGGYRFTDVVSGVLETFDADGKVISIAAANGSVLTFSYSGANLSKVQSGDGRAVSFAYTNGLITKIITPDWATIAAAYDSAKNLTSLSWQDGKVLGFLYENSTLPWALTGKQDENNSRYATFGYDSQGRAVSTEYAGGVNRYSVTQSGPAVRVVTDTFDATANVYYRTHTWLPPSGTSLTLPNGQSVSIDSQLVAGVPGVTSNSQPAGSGCAASASNLVYDSVGNLLSLDDFQGARTCYGYDSSNRETVRVEGLPTSASCSSMVVGGATLPSGARRIITAWHPDWVMQSEVTSPLRKTSIIYHGQIDPFNGNAVANCTSAAVRSDGKPLPIACKQVQQALPYTGAADYPVIEPALEQVVLLLHGGGTNGATSIVDDSPGHHSVSVVGNTQISTAQSRFAGTSIAFDGTGDYLTIPYSSNFAFGSGDFTIELFVYKTANNANSSRLWNPNGDYYDGVNLQIDGNGNFSVALSTTGNSWPYSLSVANLANGQWYHLALTRNGGSVYAFVNGVRYTVTTALGTAALYTNTSYPRVIGGQAGVNRALSGYVDEFRITKGFARYVQTFTPPAQEFLNSSPVVATSITSQSYDAFGRVLTSVDANLRTTTYAYFTDTAFSGTSDPYANNVVLLLHGNGTNGSTAITDDSRIGRSVSVVGNAKIGAAQSKFGGSSLAFDGAGDYVLVPYSSDFAFGSGDFTIETFLYKSGNNANSARIWNPNGDFYDGVNAGIDASGNFAVYASTSGTSWTHSLPIVANLANGQWYHLAITRSGGSLFAFVNGVKYTVTTALGSTALATNTTKDRVIGGQSGVDRALNGYIDEFRITKGVARYTANFTPPAAEFVNTGPAATATGHTVGDLQTVTNAAGHVTQYNLYDPAGRIRQMTDPKGVVTDITYTPRGWVSTVVVTPPGGSARTTTYSYDFVGQLTGVANPDGTSVGYTYDAAHRLTGATDAKGNSVTYTLDNVGNRIAEAIKDPGGTLQRSIARSFDALNRLQQVTGAAQ